MRIFCSRRDRDNIANFVGKDLWILGGEYMHDTDFYIRIIDTYQAGDEGEVLLCNLIPAYDVNTANHHYTKSMLNTIYHLPLSETWIDPTDVLSTEEITELVHDI